MRAQQNSSPWQKNIAKGLIMGPFGFFLWMKSMMDRNLHCVTERNDTCGDCGKATLMSIVPPGAAAGSGVSTYLGLTALGVASGPAGWLAFAASFLTIGSFTHGVKKCVSRNTAQQAVYYGSMDSAVQEHIEDALMDAKYSDLAHRSDQAQGLLCGYDCRFAQEYARAWHELTFDPGLRDFAVRRGAAANTVVVDNAVVQLHNDHKEIDREAETPPPEDPDPDSDHEEVQLSMG